MAYLKALLDFAKLQHGPLRDFAGYIYSCMYGNPAFPTPPITMEALAAKTATFQDLVSKALDGSKTVIGERDSVRAELISMLKLLAGYVGLVSENETIFLSSGFKIASNTRKQPLPLNEGIRKITFGLNSGTLRLKAIDIPGASSYQVRWAERKIDRSPLDSEWITKNFSDTRKFMVVAGLKPGTFYLFQVRALIGEEFTDWSDSATQICR